MRRSYYLNRFVGMFLLFVLTVISALSWCPRRAAAVEKETVKRTIAIVYDNSGSMFNIGQTSNSSAWCQAQYAMEIFASMMNQGDTLMIYPMHPFIIGKNGTVSYSYTENKPWIITSDSDKSKIRDIYTQHGANSNTPIESIDAAANGLKSASGEKWLIVLTDGDIFYENNREYTTTDTKIALEQRFSKYISDTNIMYLGIGDSIDAPRISAAGGNTYVAKTTVSANVPSVLTDLCNIIFGRDELPSKYYTDKTVEFDIPLAKLYIFIQGDSIGSVTLKSDSKTLNSSRSFQPSYGTLGRSTEYSKFKGIPDTTLKGYIAVYESVDAGKYSYSFSGTKSSIAYYYEPNVDLTIKMTDSKGNEIQDIDGLLPGDYYIDYCLTDKKGNKVSSELLGNRNYYFNYTFNGEKREYRESREGRMPLQIKDGDSFSLDYARVELLSGYRIEKSGGQLGFLSGTINCQKVTAEGFSVTISGGKSSYSIKEVDSATYLLKVFKDGKQLSSGELKNVKLDASVGGGLNCDVKQVSEGFEVVLHSPAKLEDVKVGTNKLEITATYESETTAKTTAKAESKFSVDYEKVDFEIKLEGDSDKYDADKIDNAVYLGSFYLDGSVMSDEKLNDITVNASVSGGLTVESVKENNGYKFILHAPSDLNTISLGENKLTVSVTYKSEITEPVTREADISFTVNGVTDTLSIKISDLNSYYSISEFKESSGAVATVFMNGRPLTPEQLAQLNISAKAGDIDLSVEPVPGESKFIITANGNQSVSKGKYSLKVTVSGLQDRMGNPLSAEDVSKFELGLIPTWVRVMIIILAILLLILLIIFILTRPALPKKIDVSSLTLKIDGTAKKSPRYSVSYPKHGAKRTLKITVSVNNAKVGFSVLLVPAKGSMVITPSAQRRAEVVPDRVKSVNIKTLNLNKQFAMDGKKFNPVGAVIKNNFSLPKNFTFTGIKNIGGSNSNFFVSGQIIYK